MYCVHANYITSLPTLKRFSEYNEGFNKGDVWSLLNVDSNIHRLKLPINIKSPSNLDIYDCPIVPDASPGIISRKCVSKSWDIKTLKKR